MEAIQPKKPNCAFAVLVTTDNYAIGAKVLAWSLFNTGTPYPLIVLCTANIAQENLDHLKLLGCDLKETSRIQLSQETDMVFAIYSDTWTKLQVFGLTEFDRIVLLDADMLVRKNIDELMTMDIPEEWIGAAHGCKCNPTKVENYPKDWTPAMCAYSKYGKAKNSDKKLQPVIGFDYFNTGLLVLTPSKVVLNELINTLKNLPNLKKYRFPDQDFLNEVYKERWVQLGYEYNALKTLQISHPNMWNDEEIKIVHYIFVKPWNLNKSEINRKDEFYTVNHWWFNAYEGMLKEVEIKRLRYY